MWKTFSAASQNMGQQGPKVLDIFIDDVFMVWRRSSDRREAKPDNILDLDSPRVGFDLNLDLGPFGRVVYL